MDEPIYVDETTLMNIEMGDGYVYLVLEDGKVIKIHLPTMQLIADKYEATYPPIRVR